MPCSMFSLGTGLKSESTCVTTNRPTPACLTRPISPWSWTPAPHLHSSWNWTCHPNDRKPIRRARRRSFSSRCVRGTQSDWILASLANWSTGLRLTECLASRSSLCTITILPTTWNSSSTTTPELEVWTCSTGSFRLNCTTIARTWRTMLSTPCSMTACIGICSGANS